MRAVAALLERRPALLALRRIVPKSEARLLTARSPSHLATLLHRHYCDLIVLGAEGARGQVLDSLRRDFPTMPVVLYAPFRSEDGDLLLRAQRALVAGLAVEGVDDPVVPRILRTRGLTARRLSELLPLAPRLELTDPLQRRIWEMVIRDAPSGLTTAAIARAVKLRRETVSRRFGAGGAPSLKRALDAVRLVAAGQLLGNPAYRVADAARLVKFSSVSLLQTTARRNFGVSARQVAQLTADQLAQRLRPAPAGRWR
jgi:AraC-like DNA-binding protein